MAKKRCPQCQEKIQAAARMCRHCGNQFTDAELKRAHPIGPKGCAVIIAVAVALVVVGAVIGSSKELDEHVQSVAGTAAPISPGAIAPYDAKDYPKLTAKLGTAGLARANAHMHDAALHAARTPGCTVVELVGISEQSTRDNVSWFVTCKDAQRNIFVDERVLGLK